MKHIVLIVKHIFFKCDSRNMGHVKYIDARDFLLEGKKHMHRPEGDKYEQAKQFLFERFPPLTEEEKAAHKEGD